MRIEDLIRSSIQLPSKSTKGGWLPVLCKVCNDAGRKGPRAGFRFSEDGRTVAYHCFNCEHKATYNYDFHNKFSYKFKQVLDGFGISPVEYNQVLATTFLERGEIKHVTELSNEQYVDHNPKSISLPPSAYRLTDEDPEDVMALEAIDYLTSRAIDWKSQPFYLTSATKTKEQQRWYGRLIIPIYKDDEVVFYQGRDLVGGRTPPYLNPHTDRANILYGYEQLADYTSKDPIYIVEGWFDAASIDGVASFGRILTPGQIFWLNKSHRPKIIVPDKKASKYAKDDGMDLVMCGLQQGWGVATPDIGDAKDINAAVCKYGKLYVLRTLRNNTHTGSGAELMARIYCGT